MSGAGIAALILTTLWLGLITLLLLLIIRQIGLITVRLDRAEAVPGTGPHINVANDGPPIGSDVPAAVISSIPELTTGRHYILLISSICTPCRELVAEMQRVRFASDQNLIALVPGRPETADSLIAMLPVGIRPVRDPEAADLARQHLHLQSTPYALQIEEGVITGKAYLYGLENLVQLIESYATSDAGEIAHRAKKARQGVSHVV